jgi:hypothetical protein
MEPGWRLVAVLICLATAWYSVVNLKIILLSDDRKKQANWNQNYDFCCSLGMHPLHVLSKAEERSLQKYINCIRLSCMQTPIDLKIIHL